jgi:TorA maturation chaperone TorD
MGQSSAAIQEVVNFVEATRTHPEAAVQETLAVDWTRLFRGVTPGYGPIPPYEGLFTDEASTHLALMHAILALYLENGAALTGIVPNRPDYLGLELAFAGFLNEAAAAAWARGEAEAAAALADRAAAFVAEHPARWAHRYFEQALPKAQTGFYRGLLRLIQAMLAEAATPESVSR